MKYPEHARLPAWIGLSILAVCTLPFLEVVGLKLPFLQGLDPTYSRTPYRIVTGLLAGSLILAQWTVLRARKKPAKEAKKILNLHYWLGAFSPLFLVAHALSPGYGYQVALTWAFIANCGLGLMSPAVPSRNTRQLSKIWLPLHIIGAIAVVALVVIHIVVVFRYN